jgi:hypothetical protein
MSETPAMFRFADFWPYYLQAHLDWRTRAAHYFGTVLGLVFVGLFAMGAGWWFLPLALVAGYGPAWGGHVLFEHNRPATFDHPFWSFVADFRMLFLWMTGELGAEIERLGFEH